MPRANARTTATSRRSAGSAQLGLYHLTHARIVGAMRGGSEYRARDRRRHCWQGARWDMSFEQAAPSPPRKAVSAFLALAVTVLAACAVGSTAPARRPPC